MLPATESSTCPRCSGSGWVPLPGDSLRVEPCGCHGDLRRRQRMAGASIPKRYSQCTLATFKEKSPLLKLVKNDIQKFIDLWPHTEKGKGLLLVGECGVGKTHLAAAVLIELIAADKPGKMLFSNFQDLIQEIQASFDSDHMPGKAEILQPLLDADLLVIDELGSQKPTTWVQDILYYVINTRYNEEKTTIFTTNYFDTTDASKRESLADRIGTRLRSRLFEMAWRYEITGVGDYRRNTL
jgi:DNA replication protein DnaC